MESLQLNYKKMGAGFPVIILHGFLGMLDNWKTFGRKLGESYEVYLLDQRDHGRSPHTEEFSYTRLSEDILAFMDQQGLKQAHIIGHSMGGKTAMLFGQTFPERVKKSVIVDMAPKAYPGHHATILEALNSIDPPTIQSRNEADEALAEYINEWGVRQFLMKNLSRNPEGGFRWKMNLNLLTESYDAILEATTSSISEIPTLFVNGTKSTYVLESDREDILEIFPAASFAGIDAGHWVHAEKGEELLEVVSQFLEED